MGYFSRKTCPGTQEGCGRSFCSKCLNYAVMTEAEAKKGEAGQVVSFCKACFKRHSSLDFDAHEEVQGPGPGEAPAVVYVHGGGSCRVMFRQHAQALASKGLRCVLLDLPGHGSRMEEPLSMQSAVQSITDTIRRLAPPCRAVKPVYVGGSLGGYIGMELLGQEPELLSAAIITMCGQNVGLGRGLAASMGLSMLGCVVNMLGQAMLLKGMMGQVRQNGHIPEEVVQEIALRPGMFFRQGTEQVAILRSTNPPAALARYMGPVLFINGSKDHRDSEHTWKAAAEKGKLIVYEGADHFFSHDTRYSERFLQDSWDFINASIAGAGARA